MKQIIIGIVLSLSAVSRGLTIDEYLATAKNKNPLFKSYDLSLQATEAKLQSVDVDLSPVLSAGYLKSKDKSLPSTLALGERSFDQYTVGLAKKFLTGSALQIEVETNHFKNEAPIVPSTDQFSTGSVGIQVSQSLWKDFLGAGTRNKIDRQRSAVQIEMTATELARRVFIIQLESDFWDYAVAIDDLKLKKSNFERAQKMESWTAKRVSNGINDRSDLMNIKALSALRALQMRTAEEELKTQMIKFRENLSLAEGEPVPGINIDMTKNRTYIKDLMAEKNVTSFESQLSKLEAVIKEKVAEEVRDNLRPDLSVFGSYSRTSFQREPSEAIQKITSSEFPKMAVGVNFSWILPTDAKSGLQASALKESLAARLRSEKTEALGLNSWMELLRKYKLSQENIKSLEQIASYQRQRAQSEQDKFLKGRTVTANVVSAVTDSAEAEVNLLKARAGLKKLEASGLLFISISGK